MQHRRGNDATPSAEDDPAQRITRREAILRVGALLGGVAFVGGDRLLAAAETASAPVGVPIGKFSLADIAFLDEIAETILPETKTPGAKAAKTGAFMALMVTDSFWPNEQAVFHDGMRDIETKMHKAHAVSFMQATPEQRLELLTQLDQEQKAVMDARDAADRRAKGLPPRPVEKPVTTALAKPPEDPAAHHVPPSGDGSPDGEPEHPVPYFHMMKQLALLGYFTSEIGYTVAMRYVETPGRYDPCLPYAEGEVAWASHA